MGEKATECGIFSMKANSYINLELLQMCFLDIFRLRKMLLILLIDNLILEIEMTRTKTTIWIFCLLFIIVNPNIYAQEQTAFLMTRLPDAKVLQERIINAGTDADEALVEYDFWYGDKNEDVLYYALYLANKTNSSDAHWIIYSCFYYIEKETQKLSAEDEKYALEHLCMSLRMGNKQARSIIKSMYLDQDYRRYDYCDSLCRDYDYFPYRRVYDSDKP